MTNITLSVSEDLHKEMLLHSEIRWSEVARQAFEKKIRELHWMDSMVSKSGLTEEDVNRIGHKIKRTIRRRIEAKRHASPG